MKDFKSHFVFNRSERNGIFLLAVIIILLQTFYFSFDFFSSPQNTSPEDLEQLARFQQQIDSVKRVASTADSVQFHSFNPNFISDYKAYTLGMSIEEIDKLHAFRAEDKWINSTVEFQEVTGISDSLLSLISPYFRFPQWRRDNGGERESNIVSASSFPVEDLNEASSEAFRRVQGVGEVLSERIVKYRKRIGGFVNISQLNDVYGLSPEVVDRISVAFEIREIPGREKKDLNSISVLALSEIPGFTYELARDVIEYRERREGIVNFNELAEIKGFPKEKLEGFKLYLRLN